MQRILRDHQLDPAKPRKEAGRRADGCSQRALAFWNNPALSPATHAALLHFAQRVAARRARGTSGSSSSTRCSIENALRQLIAVSPDLQTS